MDMVMRRYVKSPRNNSRSGLRVATWNIPYAHTRYSDVQSIIKANHIDLIGIQEYRHISNEVLSSYVTLMGHGYFCPAHTPSYGLLSLTNMYVRGNTRTELPMYDGTEQRVVFKWTLINNGKTMAFYNTHLDYEPHDVTIAQMEDVVSMLDQDSADYRILIGDFNPDYRDDYAVFTDAGYTLANGKGGVWFDTFKPIVPTTRSLDNIIVGNGITIESVMMVDVDSDISDHNMLVADLVFDI